MRSWLLAIVLVLALAGTAFANLILSPGPTPEDSFVALGAQGFGDAPRMLTLQDKGFEFGSVTPVDVVHDGAILGADKSTTPTLGVLGWTSGANVGIGFNSDQEGKTGITLDTLTLTIFNGTTPVGSFSLAAPVTFSVFDLSLQQGNGNAVFNFALDATQQAQFDTIVATKGSAGFFAGLSSSLGCVAKSPAGCLPSNDGPDSFIGFSQASVPEPSTILLLGTSLIGLGLMGTQLPRRRR